ncbi:MAG: hypothetical protein UY72_C0035G0005 [Candidatus Uhrbacteria bacterium GW2011_GWD2_52_7]|uniref:N-acetyltransferase domain-containing protein n=1 Tax=Candidatus Uhrbacteria bacterium GW2011_GWD2_52_7 TaxID=1618989 RepID=A0A0G1XFM2_9BACT|nr:MAG: hypothetical protein UY72_C0035G0005 [Candidatus Uhrbacteria bacterium GW2011_GWD2_52_7]
MDKLPPHGPNRREEGENLRVEAHVMNAEQLTLRIAQESEAEQKRFQRPDEGGAFKFFYPEDAVDIHLKNLLKYFVVETYGTIAGIAKLTQRAEDSYVISSISVDSVFQGQKLARTLLEKIFETAA